MNYRILVYSMVMFLLLVSCGDKKITNPIQGEPALTSITPSSGYIGDIVTINGKNFGLSKGTSFISINSIKVAEYIGWSDNEIKIKIPVGATTGKLSVTVNNQESNEVDFTVTTTAKDEITIGTQVWKTKNLDVSTYRDGTTIPQVTDANEWANLTTGAWCYNDNDPANGAIYGKLYNWYAVNDPRGLAPDGWHVPSDAEWSTLSTYLGGVSVAGGKLKEEGTTHWTSPNPGATNETGFTALPGGYREYYGTFNPIGTTGYWWSSTEGGTTAARGRNLYFYYSYLYSYDGHKGNGLSVRCIKD
ncbi:MAG: FISUMP domain-containing protein [bacterium]